MADALDPFPMLFDPGYRADPQPHLRRAREHGAIVASPSTGIHFVLGHAETVFAQRSTKLGRDVRLWDNPMNWSTDARRETDPLTFELYSEFQPQMFNSNPPDHRRMRSLFQHAFVPRQVAKMEQVVRRRAEALIAAMPASGTVDLMPALARPLPVQVISGILDVPEADGDKLVAWSNDLIHIVELTIRRKQKQAALHAMRQLKAYLREFVAERRQSPGDGLVDHVIAAEAVEGGLAEDELLTNLLGMLVAGHETTTNLIGNGTLCLLRHPEALAQLRGDSEVIGTAVDEMLRYEPPVNTSMRVAIEDVEVGGVPVGAGTMLILMLPAANRDPAVFDEPDRFDVTRSPNPHQTFGGGMHHCIGAPLARLEARVTFELLLQRYSTIELAGDPVWLDRINVRGLETLPLRVAE